MENLFLTDQEVIKIFREHLKIESRVISIEDLFNIRNRNRLILNHTIKGNMYGMMKKQVISLRVF